ncbi:outer membrane autotransporter protein [Ochrobactrum anthropi]|uniref:putative Ig domain-containing protein n=1 Tax=Brucella anthropi TaxID=529 RepID=UPI0015FE23B7|nr:putative Ig domain-containing protein [Brucella anthropi]MBA8862722.1 outer membrane autotransporter protein [Brucella anthropi]
MTLLRRAARAIACVCLMILTALCLNITAANAAAPIMTLGPDPMPEAKVGHFYGPVKLIASGGIGPYTFKRIVNPGEDMNFELEGDSISGNPKIAGSTVFQIEVTDATGLTEQHILHIHMESANTIRFNLDGLSMYPKEGKDYGPFQIKPTGGTEPYRFEATGLPRGVTLEGDTIYGKLEQSGYVRMDVTVTDAEDYSYTVGRGFSITPAPVIVVNDLPEGKIDIAYPVQKLAASGGTEPYRYEVSGLPEGLNFDGTDTISGTPGQSGTFPVTIVITDAEDYVHAKTDILVVAPRPDIDIDLNANRLPDGKQDLDYGSHQVKATGSTGFVYDVSGLPDGLLLNGDIVSGVPTKAATFSVTIKATDKDGYFIEKQQDILIAPKPGIDIDLDTNRLPDGKQDLDYGSHRIVATGSTGFVYEVSGLPEGLTLNGDTVSGVPTRAATFSVTIKVTDKDGYFVEKQQDIVIAPKPGIDIDLDANRLPDGKQDLDYGSHRIVATGSTGFTYDLTGLPDGLTLNGDTVSGVPTRAATFSVTIKATDKDGYVVEKQQDIVIAAKHDVDIDLDANGLPDGKINVDYGKHVLKATGGTSPYSYVVTGLPDGLSLDGDTVTGTPTKAAIFPVEVTATDADGYTVSKKQTVTIADAPTIDIGLSSLPDGQVGIDYKAELTAKGGTAPYIYVVSGLPEGLMFNGDTVSGKPTVAGSFDVEITVTDSDGYTATRIVSLVIAERPLLEAQNHELTVMAGTTGSVNLAQGAVGGHVTSAAIVAHPAAAAGKAWVESGANAQMLYFAASATFAGATELTYTLSGEGGASDPATVTIRVIARPDPSKDPEVIGLVNAQVETANRMAQMQTRNYQQRLEQLHGEGDCRQDSIGLSVGLDGAQLNPKMPQACSGRELSLWTAGEINMGKSSSGDHDKDRKLDHTSIGVTGGVDYRFSPSFTGGIGFGYGKDTTDIGQNGTKSRATMTSLAAYGSYRPGKDFFLDGVVGYGWLNFESDRFVTATGGMASGERKGQQIFGSVTLGYDYRNEAWLLSPYLRADMAHTKLEGFSETGAGIHNLTYGDQTANMLSATIGLRGEYTIPMSWGELKPKARLEYSHDFAGTSRVKLGYTDIGGLLPYTIDADAGSKDNLKIGAGLDAAIYADWTAGLDYSTQIGTGGGDLSHGLNWKLSKQF